MSKSGPRNFEVLFLKGQATAFALDICDWRRRISYRQTHMIDMVVNVFN